jgi:hypothetical protein
MFLYFYIFYGKEFNYLFDTVYQSHPYTTPAFSPYHENHLSSQNIL